jgi:hypothetical protein
VAVFVGKEYTICDFETARITTISTRYGESLHSITKLGPRLDCRRFTADDEHRQRISGVGNSFGTITTTIAFITVGYDSGHGGSGMVIDSLYYLPTHWDHDDNPIISQSQYEDVCFMEKNSNIKKASHVLRVEG